MSVYNKRVSEAARTGALAADQAPAVTFSAADATTFSPTSEHKRSKMRRRKKAK